MCRMALGVLWYISTHEFTKVTVVVPRKSFWNSKKICNMNLEVLWSNSIHWLTLITLFFLAGKSLSYSVDIRGMTGGGLDQFYAWVDPNYSFTFREISLDFSGYSYCYIGGGLGQFYP